MSQEAVPRIVAEMLTVMEMMNFMHVSRATAYQLVNSEGFPVIRIGRKILIPKKQLETWIEEHMGGAVAQ